MKQPSYWSRLGELGRSRLSAMGGVGLAVAVLGLLMLVWAPWASATTDTPVPPTDTPPVPTTVTPVPPTDTPVPTPITVSVTVDSTAGNIEGFFGSVEFPAEFALDVNVTFSNPLPTDNYVVLLTPVRLCLPLVTAKSAAGFSFRCAAFGGGSVDWAVLVGLTQPIGPREPPPRPPSGP